MEIVRALDENGDFEFGQGLNNYKTNQLAVQQDIGCNLKMFLGDCFFDISAGIDWFNLLGGKNVLALNLAINAAILNTTGVTGIQQVSINLTQSRVLTINYRVSTVYSTLQSNFSYDIGTLG